MKAILYKYENIPIQIWTKTHTTMKGIQHKYEGDPIQNTKGMLYKYKGNPIPI